MRLSSCDVGKARHVVEDQRLRGEERSRSSAAGRRSWRRRSRWCRSAACRRRCECDPCSAPLVHASRPMQAAERSAGLTQLWRLVQGVGKAPFASATCARRRSFRLRSPGAGAYARTGIAARRLPALEIGAERLRRAAASRALRAGRLRAWRLSSVMAPSARNPARPVLRLNAPCPYGSKAAAGTLRAALP